MKINTAIRHASGIALLGGALLAGQAQAADGTECIAPAKPGGGYDLTCRLAANGLLAANLIDEIAPAQDAIDGIAQRYASSSRSSSGRSIRAQARALDAKCQL